MNKQQKEILEQCEIYIRKMGLTDNVKKDIHRLWAILQLH